MDYIEQQLAQLDSDDDTFAELDIKKDDQNLEFYQKQ